MKAFRSFKIVLASTLLLASVVAPAAEKNKKLASSKDWSLWQTKVNNAEVCYIQNDDEGDWYFVVSKNKNAPNSPVEIMVQMLVNNRKSTGVIASAPGLASTMSYADIDGKKMTFIGIPKNLTAFTNIMRTAPKDKAKLRAVGGKKEETAEFSSKGFNEMMNKMQELCNGNAPLINAEFENNFVNAVADSIDPLKLDIAKIGQVRSVYFAAYPIAVELTGVRQQLSQVLVKYQPSIDELNSNRATAGRLQSTDIPAAKNELAQNQSTQKSSQAEISRVDAALPVLNAKVQASQKALDAVRAVLAPLLPEYDRITGNLSDAQSTLSTSQNRLSYIDNRLRDGANQISSLDSEARSIENSLPQKRADLDRARTIFRDADNQRSRYNVSIERERRLQSNFEYSRLRNDRQRLQNDLSRAQNEEQNVRRERDRVQNDLNVCLSQPFIEQLVPGPSVGEGGGLIPGPSEPPTDPNEPPPGFDPPPSDPGQVEPTPVRDCSQLQAALNNSNSQLAQKQNEARQIDNQIDRTDDGIRRIENQVQFDVQREYQILSDRADQARRDMDRISSDVSDDENRRAQIRQSDIPRLQNEQTDLRAERPGVQSRIAEASAAVSRNSNELAKFKTANDFDRKAAAVDTKENQLSVDQDALDTASLSKAKAQRDLQNALVKESQIKGQIDALNSQLSSLNARAVQLQEVLKGLPAERASIDQKIATLEASLKARKDQLLDLLK